MFTFATTTKPDFQYLSDFEVITGSEDVKDDIVAANTACNARTFNPEYCLSKTVLNVKRWVYEGAVLSDKADPLTSRSLHFHLLLTRY